MGLPATEYQYLIGSFFVVYSLPNIVLPFIGGALIDTHGARSVALATCLLSTAGALVSVLGLTNRSPAIAIAGRLLFGLGGETLSVAQQRITTKWFRGRELALAVGVNLSVARLGSVVNDLTSPGIAHRWSVPAALWCGFASCGMSLAMTMGLVVVDRRWNHVCPETVASRGSADPMGARSSSASTASPPGLSKTSTSAAAAAAAAANNAWAMQVDDSLAFGLVDDHDLDGDDDFLIRGASSSISRHTRKQPAPTGTWAMVKREIRTLRIGIKAFPQVFWMIQMIMILLYGTVIPFNTIHSAFLRSKWYPNDPQYAAEVMGVPDTISALLVPFVGSFFDKRGHRAHAIVGCASMILGVHFTLGALPATLITTPVPALMVLGMSYALLLTFVPVIPLLVPDRFLGTAYGINTSLANFAWTLFPVIVAGLSATDPTYFTTEMFFATCGALGLVLALVVNRTDARELGGVLNRPALGTSGGIGGGQSSTLWAAVPTSDPEDARGSGGSHPAGTAAVVPRGGSGETGPGLAAAPQQQQQYRPRSISPSPYMMQKTKKASFSNGTADPFQTSTAVATMATAAAAATTAKRATVPLLPPLLPAQSSDARLSVEGQSEVDTDTDGWDAWSDDGALGGTN
ncbi:major facilitator superfamily domain-containing protein [Blastocladiella britannica]|nr:major facilitator superfamily domain-containing protein [Blastocladiella britannica]